MISHLRGAILEKHPNRVVVEAAGVGYEVTIPVSAYSSLPDTGAEVRLHIHTHVREDALSLFGFVRPGDKALFEKLISVSGIGPKLAITVLSGLAAEDLASAIRSGSVEQLVRIPGVGKKTAERMIVELRDKIDLAGPAARPAEAKPAHSGIEEDVISALMNFGANRASAEAAIAKARSAQDSNDFDDLFRRALKLVR
jgi:Holliday junction DNA helicase RuvA